MVRPPRLPLLAYDLTSSLALASFRTALLHSRGPVLGLDIGSRHVGVAVSDPGRTIAFPHSGYRRGSLLADRTALEALLRRGGVDVAVVGMPEAPDGLECADLREFVGVYSRALFEGSSVHAVGFGCELFTTQEAAIQVAEGTKRSLRRDKGRMKEAIDSRAAAVILQDVLDIVNRTG